MKNDIKYLKTKAFLVALCLLIFIPLQSIACGPYGDFKQEKKLNSKIKSVTVFLDGAQVNRSGNFDTPIGVSEIIFEGMSPSIVVNSIQAKGRGDFTILDVRHRIHFPEPEIAKEEGLPIHIKKEISRIKDSISEIEFNLSEIKMNKEAMSLEKKILLNTNMFKGKSEGNDSIPLLKDGMAFFREKLSDINRLTLKLDKQQQYNSEQKNKMNNRLTALMKYKSNTVAPVSNTPPLQQVIVTVSSKKISRGSIDLSYMVQNAGWSAHYDLRAKNTNSPVSLTYKAKVYQKTGEDWNNVKLKLSTNNPNKGNIKPSLPIWYLDYYKQQRLATSNLSMAVDYSKRKNNNKAEYLLEENDEAIIRENSLAPSNYMQMAENIANVEFIIDLPYNINSNGESHLVEIQTSSLPSEFYHTIVPKLDRESFVMAKITDWEKLNLLPATANIFFDGTYIGETYINPLQLEDTLDISLGRDASVFVKRTKLKDNEKTQTIGNNKIKTMHFELALKNNKQSDIKLIIEDQIPVSKNDEIKVEIEEKGLAEFNEKTGLLKWTINLNQSDEEKLKFSYSIKYNKDKSLLGAL